MKIRSALSAAVSLPLLAIACSSGTSGGSQPIMCNGANVVANEKNDYTFTSTFSLPPITVKTMSNLTFDWGSVTQDFLKHSLSPTADINTVSVLIFGPGVPLAMLAPKLNADELTPQDVFVVPPPSVMPSGGKTTAMLYDFNINGTAIPQSMFDAYFNTDPTNGLPPSDYSFMVAAASGTTVGSGFRMLQTMTLDPSSSNTMVKMTNDSTKLTYNANLHSLTITGVPMGTAALTLDWSDMVNRMANNGLGHQFKDGYVTSAVVGHYTQTPAELEQKFLDLNLIATSYYTADLVSSTMLDFTTLKEQTTGAAFTGIDDTGTWLVGLTCGNCRNPAPWYLTILKPCTM
jgi:hypothetical protein